MTRVLITGGAGFIGAHLARRFVLHGAHVDLVDDFSRGTNDAVVSSLLESGSARILERDLLHKGALADAGTDYDYIAHLAAIVGVANVHSRPLAVLRDNVRMFDEVLALARRQTGLRRVLFASTSEVYAGTLEHFDLPIPTPETTALALPDLERPRTAYMLSKIYGEATCHYSGLPFTIVRPHNVYGPRMGLAHVIPELLKRAHECTDGLLEVYSVDHRRTFCYVDDAAEMIMRALEASECLGQTLNVGAQRPEVRIGDLAELVVRVVGIDAEIVSLPPTPGSPVRRCPDMSRTIALTRYEAQTDLEAGIRATYDAYRPTFASASVSGPA